MGGNPFAIGVTRCRIARVERNIVRVKTSTFFRVHGATAGIQECDDFPMLLEVLWVSPTRDAPFLSRPSIPSPSFSLCCCFVFAAFQLTIDERSRQRRPRAEGGGRQAVHFLMYLMAWTGLSLVGFPVWREAALGKFSVFSDPLLPIL